MIGRNYLAAAGNLSPIAKAALARVELYASTHTVVSGEGMCLHDVRVAYGIDSFVANTAIGAWQRAAKAPDYTHTWYNPPAGVPVFWKGGSTGAGHVAIADGKGNCYSTDIDRIGQFSLVPISDIHARWGLTYLGWSEFLGSSRVYVKG